MKICNVNNKLYFEIKCKQSKFENAILSQNTPEMVLSMRFFRNIHQKWC